jgi:hypothetical protein
MSVPQEGVVVELEVLRPEELASYIEVLAAASPYRGELGPCGSIDAAYRMNTPVTFRTGPVDSQCSHKQKTLSGTPRLGILFSWLAREPKSSIVPFLCPFS